VVTDGLAGSESRPVLLHFGEDDMGGRPSAHMIENRHLYAAQLDAALASPHIEFATGSAVDAFSFGPGLARIELANGMAHAASLIVAADGRNSTAREAARIQMVGWNYDQWGIVLTVEHELPHLGR